MKHALGEIRVQDLGVIDDVTIEFGPGLTVMTGETGAGKTLLIEALSLLLGGKSDATKVRSGAAEAVIEGRFITPESTGEDELILTRSVVANGRSKAWVNGRMSTRSLLIETGASCVELHGQHQHRSLVQPHTQRQALDEFGGIDCSHLKEALAHLRSLVNEQTTLGGDVEQRNRELDLLRYQIEEIESATISDVDEDRKLETEEDRLSSAAAHREAAGKAVELLAGDSSNSVTDRLAEVSGIVADRAPLDPFAQRIRSVMAELGDVTSELRTVVETWDDDPERLATVRTRRQLLHQLQRKYGPTLGAVLDYTTTASLQLASLIEREQRATVVTGEIIEAQTAVREARQQVLAARQAAAPMLASQIQNTLQTLAMPSARFAVLVDDKGAEDDVQFMFSANPGEDLLPLAKVASGGEMARTMLAVRLALTDDPGVLVFDEVDAGIGGTAATAVGAALASLANRCQVLVVTHLAQVAARADHHLLVRKTETEGRTHADVISLSGEDRIVELSRMLSGSPESETAHVHARELLAEASVGSNRP